MYELDLSFQSNVDVNEAVKPLIDHAQVLTSQTRRVGSHLFIGHCSVHIFYVSLPRWVVGKGTAAVKISVAMP